MSLLLKSDPLVTSLSLYDVRGAPGVAADISHVNTNSVVKGFEKDDIGEALKGAEVVVIPAGVPRKPGMTRDDLFVRLFCLASSMWVEGTESVQVRRGWRKALMRNAMG